MWILHDLITFAIQVLISYAVFKLITRKKKVRGMAIATIVEDNERFDLTSVPPDGYVVIRRMTWGEKLKRQTMLTKFRMELANKQNDAMMDVDIMQEKVSIWEFQNLIIEHNLTDSNQSPLNFKNVADITRLGPQAGEEIQRYIDKVNTFEETPEAKN